MRLDVYLKLMWLNDLSTDAVIFNGFSCQQSSFVRSLTVTFSIKFTYSVNFAEKKLQMEILLSKNLSILGTRQKVPVLNIDINLISHDTSFLVLLRSTISKAKKAFSIFDAFFSFPPVIARWEELRPNRIKQNNYFLLR